MYICSFLKMMWVHIWVFFFPKDDVEKIKQMKEEEKKRNWNSLISSLLFLFCIWVLVTSSQLLTESVIIGMAQMGSWLLVHHLDTKLEICSFFASGVGYRDRENLASTIKEPLQEDPWGQVFCSLTNLCNCFVSSLF